MFKRVGKRLLSPVGLGLLFCVGSFVVIFFAQSWALLPAYVPYALEPVSMSGTEALLLRLRS